MNDDRYELAKQYGMSKDFVDWFFDKKKDGCGNVWLIMMAAMWEGWKGSREEMIIQLPQRLSPEGYHIDEAYMVPDPDGEYLDRDEVIEALIAAGVTVKSD